MGVLRVFLLLCLLPASAFSSINLNTYTPIHKSLSGKGETKLLYFWASWCRDCRNTLASSLPELAQKFEQLEVITVNVDRSESRAKRFIEKEKLEFPVIREQGNELRAHFSLSSVPSFALLEKQGEEWVTVFASAGLDRELIQKHMSGSKNE